MNLNEIIKVTKSIKPGVFTRLTYKTELPLKSEYKKAGYHLIKITEMTTRFKINYNKLSTYKPATTVRKNPYTTIISNLLYECPNNGNRYISTFPCSSGRNTKVNYKLVFPDGKVNYYNNYELDNKDKNLVIDSYWKKPNTSTNYMKINIDNIIKIGR